MATAVRDGRLISCGPESAALIHAIHRDCFDECTGERWRLADIIKILSLPNAVGLIMTDDAIGQRPVSYLVLRWAADEAEILTVGVLPDHRRCGYGHRIVAAAESCARAQGARRLHLEVREDNHGARDLYAALGFGEVGLRRNYYHGRDGVRRNAITMSKRLVQTIT